MSKYKYLLIFPKDLESEVTAIVGDDTDKAWKLAELVTELIGRYHEGKLSGTLIQKGV